jgi:hypothetical protein
MALYARVITAATVREPRSSILSRYKMCGPIARTLTNPNPNPNPHTGRPVAR